MTERICSKTSFVYTFRTVIMNQAEDTMDNISNFSCLNIRCVLSELVRGYFQTFPGNTYLFPGNTYLSSLSAKEGRCG